MGIKMGKITDIEERGRVLIPKGMRDEMNLKPGQKVIVEKHDSSIVIRKAADLKDFSKELKGCIKKSKLKPIEMKRIWGRT